MAGLRSLPAIPLVLETHERRAGDLVILELRGELDIATAPGTEERVQALLEQGSDVLLDLEALAFIDSSGIRMLLQSHRAAERTGRQFTISHGSAQVERVLTLAGVTGVFTYGSAPPAAG